MNPEAWGFIGAIIGAIVGAAASIVTTIISGRHTRQLQELSDSFERKERSRTFQRTNLLEVQETLAAYVRLIGRAFLEDSAHFRKNPEATTRGLLSAALNQEIMDCGRRLMLLIERVENEDTRTASKRFRSDVDKVLDAHSTAEGERILLKSAGDFQTLMSEIGTVLRRLY